MTETDPRAKRHSDYVQIVPLLTPSPEHGVAPSLETFAAEELRANFRDPEPDGYIRISKAQAEELLPVMDDYVVRFGPLLESDEALAEQLRCILASWE